MNLLRTVAVVLVALAVVVAAAYAVFAVVLVSADRSAYTANTTAAFDYDAVVANATAAGYDVERVGSSGFHPDGTPDLDAELGADYEVVRTVFYHPDGWRFEANVFAGEGRTELVVFGPEFGPVDPDALPDAWLLDRVQLTLGVDSPTAQRYVDEMRGAVTDDAPIPRTYAAERLRFSAVYAAFEGHERTVTTGMPGQGWTELHYASDGRATGELHFVVARAEVTDRDGRLSYVLNVDRNGGVGVTVHGPAGMERSDAELRAAVRERFAAVGIPPTAADGLRFEYDPSVW
ncbi:hypothetical protein [Halorarius halobius]|uniref:hypothetical protein n=1 Tax=Halorarius halobius TaxID=2962671 RepID=UPI0020CF25A4|nr:hypothetical protein [Halorarius halobius]